MGSHCRSHTDGASPGADLTEVDHVVVIKEETDGEADGGQTIAKAAFDGVLLVEDVVGYVWEKFAEGAIALEVVIHEVVFGGITAVLFDAWRAGLKEFGIALALDDEIGTAEHVEDAVGIQREVADVERWMIHLRMG